MSDLAPIPLIDLHSFALGARNLSPTVAAGLAESAVVCLTESGHQDLGEAA